MSGIEPSTSSRSSTTQRPLHGARAGLQSVQAAVASSMQRCCVTSASYLPTKHERRKCNQLTKTCSGHLELCSDLFLVFLGIRAILLQTLRLGLRLCG